ncbi:MAG: hypothetical protein ACR2OJ_08130 [Hyphomicrobiales bacterium]
MELGEYLMHYLITRHLGALLGAAMMLCSVSYGTHAATFNRSDIIDLNADGSITGGQWIGNGAVSFAPVTLNIGDVFVLTISFANGKALEVSDSGNINQEGVAFIFGTADGDTVSTSSMTYFNLLAGDLLANPFASTTICTNCYSAGTLSANLTDTHFTFDQVTFTTTLSFLPGSFGGAITLSGGSFGAFHADTKIVDVSAQSPSAGTANIPPRPSYMFAPGGGSCSTCATGIYFGSSPTIVPIPPPFAMFLTGLLGLGLLARRKGQTKI